MPPRLFLPGAGGDPAFWQPLAEKLSPGDDVFPGWPGLGEQAPHPRINSYNDLADWADSHRPDGSFDILAQSMGGVIAIAMALRHPQKVRRMVLAVTSGGFDLAAAGGQDWRNDYRRTYPKAAPWATTDHSDRQADLSAISQPVLLLFGDADPVAPVAAGRFLKDHLPQAQLIVVKGGGHDLVRTHAEMLAPVIDAFLS